MARESVSGSFKKALSFGDDPDNIKKGETFEGYYKYSKDTETVNGTKKIHVFSTAEGETEVWGTGRLNVDLSKIAPGTKTWITYQGLGPKEKGKFPAKMFLVEADKDDTIFVDVPKVSFRDEETPGEDGDDDYTPPPAAPSAVAAGQVRNGSDKAAASRTRVEAILAGRKTA